MRQLIHADIKRILLTVGFYIPMLLLGIWILVYTDGVKTPSDLIGMLRRSLGAPGMTFLCIPIFLKVYGDDLKSGAFLTVIGRGLSRNRLVWAKLLDCAILLAGSYLVEFLVCLYAVHAANMIFSPRQRMLLLLYCLYEVIRGVGFFALASLVLFLTMSAAGGLLTLLVGGLVSGLCLKALQGEIVFPIYDLSFEGLLDSSFAMFEAGETGWQLVPALCIYLLGVILLNMTIFGRKELEL